MFNAIKSLARDFLRRKFVVSAKPTLNQGVRSVHRELLAVNYLSPLMPKHYFPWTTGSLRPSGLITIVNEIAVNHREYVVECGAGASTLVIASALKQFGGRLISLEEDAGWATYVTRALQNEGLDEVAQVLHVPLKPSNLSPHGEQWYDLQFLRTSLANGIDLLVVDGPGIGLMRYPAGPFFKQLFADDFAVILDDIPKGGREFVRQWQDILQIRFRILNDFAWGSKNPNFKLFLSP
jgi:hypothetical protein